MTQEFTDTRTGLANNFATAGADLLAYMGSTAALAAIPDTEPPRYVVAGTLADIVKLLPAAEVIKSSTAGAAKGGITSVEGLTRYNVEMYGLGDRYFSESPNGRWVEFADVERLLASTAGEQAEPAQVAWESDTHKSSDAKRVMMSAFAFCPSELSHPQKMAWIGDFFCKHFTQAAPASSEQVQATALRKLCDQLDGMKRRLLHTPGTGQHHSYLIHEDVEAYVEEARKSIAAPIAAQVQAIPAGWKLMPIEPTEQMVHAAEDVPAPRHFGKVYRAMLGAAPIAAAPAAEEVRNQALDEAAKACGAIVTDARARAAQHGSDNENGYYDAYMNKAMSASQCAEAIRAMKRAASTEGGA